MMFYNIRKYFSIRVQPTNFAFHQIKQIMTQYKGQLEGFPTEVVEWMQDQQEAQGNKRDVSVFERDIWSSSNDGGIIWDKTKEGYYFCKDVIYYKRFYLFFERYPKKSEPIETTDFKEKLQFNEAVITKPEPSRIEVVTQIVCAYIANEKYDFVDDSDLVKGAISIADEIFKQCNK